MGNRARPDSDYFLSQTGFRLYAVRYIDGTTSGGYFDRMASSSDDAMRIAELVRTACIAAAQRGFDDAAISGLCHDGAAECAIGAIRAIDLQRIIQLATEQDDNS